MLDFLDPATGWQAVVSFMSLHLLASKSPPCPLGWSGYNLMVAISRSRFAGIKDLVLKAHESYDPTCVL